MQVVNLSIATCSKVEFYGSLHAKSKYRLRVLDYRIASNFRGQNICGGLAILRHFVGNIFVVGACTAGKCKQGYFIRG